MADDTLDPSLGSVLGDVIRAALAQVHVALPARVETFDAGPPARVKVSIGVDFHRVGEGDTRERYTPPQVANVPVVYPSAGDYSLTFPLAQGDYVLLVCAERSISEWLRNGGVEVEPGHPRRHSLTDAVAIPGLRPTPSDIAADRHDGNALVLGVPAGKSIKLGHTATKGVNREGDDVEAAAALAAYATAVNTALSTLSSGAGVPIVAPPAITTGQVIAETGAGSSVVKADD